MIEIVPNWHPVWVHFPIALLCLSAVLFWVAQYWRHPVSGNLTLVARWNLAFGVLFLLPTMVTGYLAYVTVPHDAEGHAAMGRHLTAAWVTTVLFLLAAAWAWRQRSRPRGATAGLLGLLLAGLIAITVTGYLGGENVYRHGIGVERLPDADGHEHHSHGDNGSDSEGGDGKNAHHGH